MYYGNGVYIYLCTSCSVTSLTIVAVKCIDVLEVEGRESRPLSELVEGDGAIHWLDGRSSITSEGKGTIVHHRADIIGDSLSGHKRSTHDIKVVLNSCEVCVHVCVCGWRCVCALYLCEFF